MHTLDDKQFDLTAQAIKYPEEHDPSKIFLSGPQQEMLNKFNTIIEDITFNLDGKEECDDSEDYDVQPVDCKYYTIEEFQNLKIKNDRHFSILHINISSIQFHIEEFRIILQLLKHKMDFICIFLKLQLSIFKFISCSFKCK